MEHPLESSVFEWMPILFEWFPISLCTTKERNEKKYFIGDNLRARIFKRLHTIFYYCLTPSGIFGIGVRYFLVK
jgi:hypothetical protein